MKWYLKDFRGNYFARGRGDDHYWGFASEKYIQENRLYKVRFDSPDLKDAWVKARIISDQRDVMVPSRSEARLV